MRTVIARENTPNGELQLQRRGDNVYEIIYNGVFLMASYNEPSARALVRLALARLSTTRTDLRLLVGGLGMGYTLASALAAPRVRRADVVEIEPLIVQWNREYLGDLAGNPLDNSRTRLIESDLAIYLAESDVTYDALLLDVDNGPGWLSVETNTRLYDRAGLTRMKGRLASGGVLAIWSADTSSQFLNRLTSVFGNATAEHIVDCTPEGREITATIYLAEN